MSVYTKCDRPGCNNSTENGNIVRSGEVIKTFLSSEESGTSEQKVDICLHCQNEYKQAILRAATEFWYKRENNGR